jgi:hypothetical protein
MGSFLEVFLFMLDLQLIVMLLLLLELKFFLVKLDFFRECSSCIDLSRWSQYLLLLRNLIRLLNYSRLLISNCLLDNWSLLLINNRWWGINWWGIDWCLDNLLILDLRWLDELDWWWLLINHRLAVLDRWKRPLDLTVTYIDWSIWLLDEWLLNYLLLDDGLYLWADNLWMNNFSYNCLIFNPFLKSIDWHVFCDLLLVDLGNVFSLNFNCIDICDSLFSWDYLDYFLFFILHIWSLIWHILNSRFSSDRLLVTLHLSCSHILWTSSCNCAITYTAYCLNW